MATEEKTPANYIAHLSINGMNGRIMQIPAAKKNAYPRNIACIWPPF